MGIMVMVAAIMPERRLHGAFPVIQPSTGAYLGPAHSRAWMMEDDKPERTWLHSVRRAGHTREQRH